MKIIPIIFLGCCMAFTAMIEAAAQSTVKWSAPLQAYPKAWAQTAPPPAQTQAPWWLQNPYAAYAYGRYPTDYWNGYAGRGGYTAPQQGGAYGYGWGGYAAPATYGYQQMYGAF